MTSVTEITALLATPCLALTGDALHALLAGSGRPLPTEQQPDRGLFATQSAYDCLNLHDNIDRNAYCKFEFRASATLIPIHVMCLSNSLLCRHFHTIGE
jgi:hypothetical protein